MSKVKVFQTTYRDKHSNVIDGLQLAIDMTRTMHIISKYGLSLTAEYPTGSTNLVIWTCRDIGGMFHAEGATPAYAVDAWDMKREDYEETYSSPKVKAN